MPLKLELKVFFSENFLGVSLDQVNGSYSIPLTSYYLWPRTNAWEQLKIELESKQWINGSEKIKMLNLIVEIMNHWREKRDSSDISRIKKEFPELNFVNL